MRPQFRFIYPGEPIPPDSRYIDVRSSDGAILVEVKAAGRDTQVVRAEDVVRYLPAE
jgi:hypothetical protein